MRRILLPPVLPALFTLLGAAVHRGAWRVEPLPAPWPVVAGGILILTAVGMAATAFIVFRRHDESLDLRKPTRRLVSENVYGISRNPVYLAFLVFIAGLGCANNAAAVLLAVVPAFAALNWYTIPHEETYLRRKLGAAYDEYAARVRRWI
jgi:protein-S-isoprenylcysteine O-methyltransferase Ste14